MNVESELPSTMDGELVTKSLNFHGQLLQKQWEAERGEGELQKHDIGDLDFGIYGQRQRHLSFQDRGKRLKLHQFISKRADVLFNTSIIEKEVPTEPLTEPGLFAVLPAFETFLNLDKTSRTQHFFQCLRVADVIICTITNKTNSGLFLKVMCLSGENVRPVFDLNVKAFCPTSNLISAIDKKNIPRTFMLNDLVACEVLEIVPDAEKIICGMKGVHASEHKSRLGLFFAEDLPEAYKLSLEGKSEPYEALLEKSPGFHNPSNVTCLSRVMGLGNQHHTNILGLKGRFPETEYANELRSLQAAKWAHKSVTDGIDHFKSGRITEAHQCLNKAISIDPNNIEALVARGALYANKGNFKKGIEDFEQALKINPTHVNGKKYMTETLVAYGRNFEDSSQYDEARKCYERCLDVFPYHEEAMNSLEYVKHKMATANGTGTGSLTDGLTLTLGKTQGVKDTLKQLLETPAKDDMTSSAKKKKKEKKVKKNKRHSSSGSSSSSSSGSSSSSSDSSSSDSSSASSNDSHRKKKHKSRKSEGKEKSLSPLSKRMATMDSGVSSVNDGQRGSYNPPAMPYSFSSDQSVQSAGAYPSAVKTDKESEYEQRVCKFLEQTKGDSDYEEKVRKFLDETAKWKKDRKAFEEKAKKKRKKEKKARSKSKLSKKKKREERKKKKLMLKEFEEKKLREALKKQRRRSANVEDDEEFLYGEKPDSRLSLPDLEDLQSKLSYFVKMEKGASKKKEKSSSVEKMVAAAQMKAKASSPKVLYLEEEKEEARARKLADKKKMDMFEESPPQVRVEAKNVPLPPVPPPSSSKFKMQLSNAPRLKKRSEEKESWNDEEEKRYIYVNENVSSSSKKPQIEDKMPLEKKKELEEIAKAPTVMDKLGGFRINPLAAEKKNLEMNRNQAPTSQKRKLRNRVSESDSSDSDVANKKKDRPTRSPASSRSRSRSNKKYSSESPPAKKYSSSSSRSPSYHRKDRSRSKSGSYRSRSGRRYRSSESGSYRSRSRSRSRSMDYHRRSRSRSDDRHRYHKYPGRYPRNRGTYYRPRFQTGGFQKRPGFYPRNRGGPWRPNNRPFNRPFMRGRGRPRFFHNNYKPRDDRYRRYDRDMSRSDDDDGSPMRKVDAAKERIDRMLREDKRHSGPLSEGEERDDYDERKDYDRERSNARRSSSPDMDRTKKEGSKEKSNSKPDPW